MLLNDNDNEMKGKKNGKNCSALIMYKTTSMGCPYFVYIVTRNLTLKCKLAVNKINIIGW